jgi:hypothetical protein
MLIKTRSSPDRTAQCMDRLTPPPCSSYLFAGPLCKTHLTDLQTRQTVIGNFLVKFAVLLLSMEYGRQLIRAPPTDSTT